MKPNAIVLCCTANWLPYAAATLLSCVRQGAAAVADLHVVTLPARAEEKACFKRFCAAHGLAATLTEAVLPEALAGFSFQRFSPAALLRLTLDHILPQGYERVLYLDSDILAEGPVAEIFAANLKGKTLGAVEDYQSLPGPLALFSSHTAKIGLERGAPYFNSGVLLFDWAKTCKAGHMQRCIARIATAAKTGQDIDLPDQDVLNLEFAGEWTRLDLRFNLMAFFVDYFPQTPVFRHFSNLHKPWGPLWQPGFAKARAFYRKTFAQSPWPEFTPGRYHRPSLESAAILLRKLDPISRHRYARHLARPEQ